MLYFYCVYIHTYIYIYAAEENIGLQNHRPSTTGEDLGKDGESSF